MEQARKIREQRREDGSAEADAAKFKASMSTPKVNKVEVMAGESIDTFLAKKVSFVIVFDVFPGSLLRQSERVIR